MKYSFLNVQATKSLHWRWRGVTIKKPCLVSSSEVKILVKDLKLLVDLQGPRQALFIDKGKAVN